MRAAIAFMCALAATSLVASPKIDLSGEWSFALDPEDRWLATEPAGWSFHDSIQLPNTTALAGKGNPQNVRLSLEQPAMQRLHQKFGYIGPAWYQRSVAIPADWQDRSVELILERALWESRVWINGQSVGMRDSLSAPHRYALGDQLRPGETNTLTIRIDNREKLPIGIGHAYTEETQSIWNGAVGRLELRSHPKARVSHLRLRPDFEQRVVEVSVEVENLSGRAVAATLDLSSSAGGQPASLSITAPIGVSSHSAMLRLPPDTAPWCEFSPALHEVTASLSSSYGRSVISDSFGLRSFAAKGRQLLINQRPVFLRGNLECAIFPKTGHPDMSGEEWTRIFQTALSFGLNHIRFHSYCPPKAAFEAADRLGIYLQVELPNWSFHMGQRPEVDAFFMAEGRRIFREYGNHPSFVMLSLGNELTGDYEAMDRMIEQLRQLEPSMLFTSTSFSFSPRGHQPGPQDDFFVSQQTNSGWVRGQGFLNVTVPNTMSDYREGLASVAIPLVTHEVGQYNNYPNLTEIEKYEAYGSPFRPTAWESIRADLAAKGRLAEAARYTRDSGKLAVILYKEDIERSLRTPEQAGIQLLQLQDFPGQSTATVGVLDSFWETKGLIEASDFRQFNAPTVPLARMAKLVWENTETFAADIEVAHFGPRALGPTVAQWSLAHADQVVGEGSFSIDSLPLGNGISLGQIRHPLASVAHPVRLTLSVRIPDADARNDWSVWVYPAIEPAAEPAPYSIHRSVNADTLAALAEGRTLLLLPPAGAIKQRIDGRFIPVFWSPLHFPNQPGTLGATIDASHPVFRLFPTETHTNWQWWELLANSASVDLSTIDESVSAPFRFIDKYNRNGLPTGIFEVRVGPGRLLVCTLDVESNLPTRLAARQLRRSLDAYLRSAEFAPRDELSPAQLQSLFGETALSARASSAHSSHPAHLGIDGNPDTFWHSDWTTGATMPFHFDLDLLEARLLHGFRYLPRQDQANGRIGSYAVQVSMDGEQWRDWHRPSSFGEKVDLQTVDFDQPIQTRFFRLIIREGRNGHAAIANLEPITTPLDADSRALGLVPGFNQ
jgi:hypothetical protein